MIRIFIIFVTGLSLLASRSWARPVDLSAPNVELGSAGSKGYLEIWKEVDGLGLQLGSSYLTFRYKFTTDPSVSGGLGPGYYVPMFEARSVLIRERVMRANLPCGKVLYFWQDPYDPAKFQTVDKEWTGIVHDQDFTVSRDDGWAITYRAGKLTSIKTDKNNIFKWNYTGSIVSSIDEDGVSVITVQPNLTGQVGSIVSGAKSYEIGYDKRPMTEIVNGIVLIKDLPLALSSFKTPDGKKDTFSFELSQDRIPGLTVTDAGGQTTEYEWNPTNNYLTTENGPAGNWTYTVGKIAQTYGLPPLTRTSSDGKTEGISVDTKTGIYTVVDTNGVKTITQVFETPGPLYQKVKSVEEISGGVTNTVMKASYDETGNLIRKIGANGFVTTFTYDTKGKEISQVTALTKDPVFLAKLQKKEQAMKDFISHAGETMDKQFKMIDLAEFYLFEMGDRSKAAGVIALIPHDYAFGVRMQMIDNDESLSPLQKVAGYKDLLKEYPEHQDAIDFMIKARIQENKDAKNG